MSVFASATAPAPAATEKVVYSFKGGSDGANPQASLLGINGVLYGTTAAGGVTSCGVANGCGTVFKVGTTGKEKVLHSFQGGSDGYDPVAGLIDVKGTLYGTTSSNVAIPGSWSCSTNCGTVFSITSSGIEKVLHVFNGGSDGGGPNAGLVDVGGTLYGVTEAGGTNTCVENIVPCGTVFSITRRGTEKVLHTFDGADGFIPGASLINVKGTLYGSTLAGGSGSCTVEFPVACGTVFSITPGGAEAVVYSFTAGSDGQSPQASLVNVKGVLYGTTSVGGGGICAGNFWGSDCGTVFSIELKTGKEKVLYAFKGGSDGAIPVAGLTSVPGVFESTLYGTTSQGGAYNLGTVFSVNPLTGKETVVYAFKGGSDGANPQAGLIDVNGTLYGTTMNGGTSGLGTVFSITP